MFWELGWVVSIVVEVLRKFFDCINEVVLLGYNQIFLEDVVFRRVVVYMWQNQGSRGQIQWKEGSSCWDLGQEVRGRFVGVCGCRVSEQCYGLVLGSSIFQRLRVQVFGVGGLVVGRVVFYYRFFWFDRLRGVFRKVACCRQEQI